MYITIIIKASQILNISAIENTYAHPAGLDDNSIVVFKNINDR